MILFTLIYGYCSGCFVSLIAPCAAQLGPTNTAGTRLGMMFAIMSFGGVSVGRAPSCKMRSSHPSPHSLHSFSAHPSLATSWAAARRTSGGLPPATRPRVSLSASPSSPSRARLPSTTKYEERFEVSRKATPSCPILFCICTAFVFLFIVLPPHDASNPTSCLHGHGLSFLLHRLCFRDSDLSTRGRRSLHRQLPINRHHSFAYQ